jgi:Amt family ammonium transporter
MLFGAGLLWMGWTGFNGGDPYVVSSDASLAVLNTHLCTATSSHWVGLDIIFFPKAYVIGAAQGMITGLVCITPAAGKSNIKKNFQYQVLNLMYILAMQINMVRNCN